MGLKQFLDFCVYSVFKPENGKIAFSKLACNVGCYMYLLLGYIRAGSATWFPCNTCLQGNHWVITGIQHCNSTSAGTDGTILRPSYLASLPSCVRMKECQMSGFNTETLTVGCISTLIILQIYSLFLSALFLLSTWYARLLSLDTVP